MFPDIDPERISRIFRGPKCRCNGFGLKPIGHDDPACPFQTIDAMIVTNAAPRVSASYQSRPPSHIK
jgi:hypothetical protein